MFHSASCRSRFILFRCPLYHGPLLPMPVLTMRSLVPNEPASSLDDSFLVPADRFLENFKETGLLLCRNHYAAFLL
jgi:hypothetical protein